MNSIIAGQEGNSEPLSTKTPIKPQLIRQQLELILSSPYFKNRQQLCNFLRFVVEEKLAGRGKNLKQYTIAVKAFGRPANFNPQIDPIVRIEARRLRHTLTLYYQEQGSQDLVQIEIPKGSYKPIFKDKKTQNMVNLTSKTLNSELFLSIEQAYPSILITPFVFQGTNSELVYIADGITEEISIALTKFKDFVIIGPLSWEKIAHNSPNWQLQAQKFQTQFILEGSIDIQGAQGRIRVKLLETDTNRILWANSYQYHLYSSDWFSFQDEVASQVSATIADIFGVIPRRLKDLTLHKSPELFEAYDAVLHYYHYFSVLTTKAWNNAYQALERAVQLESNYAPIYAMLADLYGVQYHLMGVDAEILQRHEALVERAIAIDPYCQLARLMKSMLYFFRGQRNLFNRRNRKSDRH